MANLEKLKSEREACMHEINELFLFCELLCRPQFNAPVGRKRVSIACVTPVQTTFVIIKNGEMSNEELRRKNI